MRLLKKIILIISVVMPSALRVLLYRLIGFKIGKRVKFGFLSVILTDKLEILDDACIDPLTLIFGLEEFVIGKQSRIAIFSVIYGSGSVVIADRCLVSVNCLVECGRHRKVLMKNYSCFGPRNTVYTHGGYLPLIEGYPFKFGDVVIGEYSWTGMGTIILPNTEIGDKTIVAPGAVITGKINSGSFIRPHSYKYEITDIKTRIKNYTAEQISVFIQNAIYIAVNNLDLNDFELSDLFTRQIKDWNELAVGNKLIIYLKDTDQSKLLNSNSIIAGYKLPETIRSDNERSWIDFYSYSASGDTDLELLKLVYKLNNTFNFKIIFV